MNIKVLTRGVAYVVLAVALLATAIALNNRQYRTAGSLQGKPSDWKDSLDLELTRCKALGTAAASHPACKAAWQTNRERFFNSEKLYQDRVTGPAQGVPNHNQSKPVVGSQLPSGAPVAANRAGQPQ